jgi:hypothetical protein
MKGKLIKQLQEKIGFWLILMIAAKTLKKIPNFYKGVKRI